MTVELNNLRLCLQFCLVSFISLILKTILVRGTLLHQTWVLCWAAGAAVS